MSTRPILFGGESSIAYGRNVQGAKRQSGETSINRSDRRPETKQGIKGKIVRFRSGRIRDRVRVMDKDRRSEAINFGAC